MKKCDPEDSFYTLNKQMLMVFALVLLIAVVHSSVNIPEHELSALKDLYDATNGPDWKWSDEMIQWNFSQPDPNPCLEKWKGIYCMNDSVTAWVDEINLQFMALNGTVPPSIGNFTSLTQLMLDSNYNLRSSIPRQLGQLSKLEVLTLSMNQFSGTIPNELSNCLQLSTFNMYFNNIVGSVPNGFTRLSKMFDFGISNNYITGNLDFASNWTDNLSYFQVSSNQFNSTIPDSFCYSYHLYQLNLEFNYLRGPLPSCWNDKSPLRIMALEQNDLTGTLPREISLLPSLYDLALGWNHFHGSIPFEYMNMTMLSEFMLRYNHFSGPFPANLSNLAALAVADFTSNHFTGWLPQDLSRLTALNGLLVTSNYLSGPIPDTSGCKNLDFFLLANNLFSCSIPASFGDATKMHTFEAYNNHLTGSLPESIQQMTLIAELSLYNNQLTGNIFDRIGGLKVLSQCFLNNNLLSGSMPSSMDDLGALIVLLLQDNLLSGSVPSLHGQVSLEQVFLYSNLLTGPITDVFNCTTQPNLMYVDVSNNELSEELPRELFTCPKLQSFAALSNCFSGPLPVEMCSATNLTSLVLDGLMSATSCQKRFFKNFEAVVSYGLSSRIPDGIPECLFTLPKLETLHLSGNGLTGTLSRELVLSESLKDLSLSHNSLRGEIPVSLRYHRWSQLDLSYNKMTGTFEETLVPSSSSGLMLDNTSLSLKVNRLSGKIPPELKDLGSIAILDGNIFACDASRSSLPPEDPDYQIYSCGSNSFNDSLYLWCAVMGIALLSVVVLWLILNSLSDAKLESSSVSGTVVQVWHKLSVWMSVFGERSTALHTVLSNVKSFGVFVGGVRKIVVLLTVFIVCILLPTYIVLSEYYDTYTFEYAWSVSGAYLSGVTPAVVLFFLLLLFGVCASVLIVVNCKRIVYAFASSNAAGSVSQKAKWLHSATLIAVVVWNMVLVTGVNIAYVYIDHHYSSSVVLVTQVFVALFKVSWNNFIVPYVLNKQITDHQYESELARLSMSEDDLSKGEEEEQLSNSIRNTDDAVVYLSAPPASVQGNHESYTRGISLAVFVMLFNNIAAPFIATGYVSSNCFYDIVTSPPEVQVTYTYAQCSSFMPLGNVTYCTGYKSEASNTLQYPPPFLYSYQCASTFITTYANIFVLMLTIDTFFIPLLMWACKVAYDRVSPYRSAGSFRLVSLVVPPILKPVDVLKSVKELKLFQCDVFVVKTINIFAVLCTFGAILPPVAVICCVAVFSVTLHSQVLQGRFVYLTRPMTDGSVERQEANKASCDKLRAVLNKDCEGAVDMFLSGVHMIVPFAAIFYGLVLFDTLGDAVGWQRALVVPLLICAMPLVMYVRQFVRDKNVLRLCGCGGREVRMAVNNESGTTYSYVHQPSSPQYAPMMDETQSSELNTTLL